MFKSTADCFFKQKITDFVCFMIFLVISHFQIYVISLAEPRLPLQLDDAVRPEVEGEEVEITLLKYCASSLCLVCKTLTPYFCMKDMICELM